MVRGMKTNHYIRLDNLKAFLLAGLFLFFQPIGVESVRAEACIADTWDLGQAYSRGDTVAHVDHEWQAKRNTTGVPPGTHKPTWRDLGACGTGRDGGGDGGGGDPPGEPTPMQVFGLWHAGNHYADWAYTREFGEFDWANNWIVAGNGGFPVVNLVVLSFLHPMQVLDFQNENIPGSPVDLVPDGMEMWVVNYFKSCGVSSLHEFLPAPESSECRIRVMMSIGGVTYTDAWDEALALDAARLGKNAAAIAEHFGVGIEIDYERNVAPNLAGLQAFIDAYRGVHPYDPSGGNPAARLTIDLAAGGRYLQDLNRHATEKWLKNDPQVLDYANAMVHRRSGSPDNWQEHITGMPTYDPVIPPKPPNKFTGSLYLKGNMANCTYFINSEQAKHAAYVESVNSQVNKPNSTELSSNGMLGFMFWAAEYPSARKNYVATVPPNSCEDGMGVAAMAFGIENMLPLRQQ